MYKLNKNAKYYQQGDVLIVEIDELPIGLELLDTTNLVDSPNGHKVSIGRILTNNDGEKFLDVPTCGCTVSHKQHSEIQVPCGIYCISQVLEYDHFLEESREVID